MYKRLALFLISIISIFGIIYFVGFYDVVDSIISIKPLHFLMLLIIQFSIMLLSALKWRVVLRDLDVSFVNLLLSSFIGYLVNNITPIGLAGGEPIRAYALSKTSKIPIERSIASVIVDLFLEIFPIFLLSGTAIFLVFLYGVSIEIGIILGFLAFLLLILFILSITLVTNKRFSIGVIRLCIRMLAKIPHMRERALHARSQVDKIYMRFNKAMRANMTDTKAIISGTIISIVSWCLKILRVYLIFMALGITIQVSTVIIVETVVIVLSFLPLLPGSLGIWEGSSIALFVLLGAPAVTEVIATSATIIDRILFYVIPSILGVICAMYLGINISRIADSEEFQKDIVA